MRETMTQYMAGARGAAPANGDLFGDRGAARQPRRRVAESYRAAYRHAAARSTRTARS